MWQHPNDGRSEAAAAMYCKPICAGLVGTHQSRLTSVGWQLSMANRRPRHKHRDSESSRLTALNKKRKHLESDPQ